MFVCNVNKINYSIILCAFQCSRLYSFFFTPNEKYGKINAHIRPLPHTHTGSLSLNQVQSFEINRAQNRDYLFSR